MKILLKQFIEEEEGQALVEYAMLISLVALVCMSAVHIYRNGIANTYTNIDNKMVLNTST